MTVETVNRKPADWLSLVLEDHLDWVSQWQRAVIFPKQMLETPEPPISLMQYMEEVGEGVIATQPAMARLLALHNEMHQIAALILTNALNGQQLIPADFDSVMVRFAEFTKMLRRMEKAFAVAESGIDPLTGLRSRGEMESELEAERDRFIRTGQRFCIAICDVDHFKKVNDTHGHDAGDIVLEEVAACVQRKIRSFDDAYRMGGEEFLICLKNADLSLGSAVIERLRESISQMQVDIGAGQTLSLTASFGVTEIIPDISIEDAIAMADKALYVAKEEGRNKVVTVKPKDCVPA